MFRKAFCRKMKCVLPQNEMHFAAKWNAFCRKMEPVLPQNGKRFAAKWKAFCRKMEIVWPKMESVYALDPLRLYDFTCLKPWQIPYYWQEREHAKLELNVFVLPIRHSCRHFKTPTFSRYIVAKSIKKVGTQKKQAKSLVNQKKVSTFAPKLATNALTNTIYQTI